MVRTGIQFQLTASRRGWRKSREAGGEPMIFQLTASRRGWPGRRHRDKALNHISTHSLTKRLTYINAGTLIVRDISTHSLTKRLTIASRTLPGGLEYFNSQPHEEADAVLLLLFALLTYFNSQPHEEADSTFCMFSIFWFVFQLTASRRGWRISKQEANHRAIFQLTASRRGWPVMALDTGIRIDFNSQPHEEADGVLIVSTSPSAYFNSQPHEEADEIRIYWICRA